MTKTSRIITCGRLSVILLLLDLIICCAEISLRCLGHQGRLVLVSNRCCFFLLINRSDGHDGVTYDDDKKRKAIQEQEAHEVVNFFHPLWSERSKVDTLKKILFVWMFSKTEDYYLCWAVFSQPWKDIAVKQETVFMTLSVNINSKSTWRVNFDKRDKERVSKDAK